MRKTAGLRYCAALSLVTLAGCGLPYKPLNGKVPTHIGYTVEHLGGNEYRVEYRAGPRADYAELKTLLRRYATELCPDSAVLGVIKQETFVPVVWTDGDSLGSRQVLAAMRCNRIDETVLARSSFSRF